MKINMICAAITALSIAISSKANAGLVLFANDVTGGDSSIAEVLSADGHNVTSLIGGFDSGINSDLTGNLSSFDAVFWSASGSSSGNLHEQEQFSSLISYVFNGGNVFVTGYDSIASPGDPWLIDFVGGGSSVDLPGTNLTALTGANDLTKGLFDIEGSIPTGAGSDRDGLNDLTVETSCLSFSDNSSCQWSLRNHGLGQIAYVSAGHNAVGIDSAWTQQGGSYNAAIRNFAYNASGPVEVPEPSTIAILAFGLFGLVSRRHKK